MKFRLMTIYLNTAYSFLRDEEKLQFIRYYKVTGKSRFRFRQSKG